MKTRRISRSGRGGIIPPFRAWLTLFAALSILTSQARAAISLTTGNISYNSGSSSVTTSGSITISPAMAAGDVMILSVSGSGMIDASGTNIEFHLLDKAGSSSMCEAVLIGRATGAASSFTVNQTTSAGLSVVGAVFTSTNRLLVDVSQVGTASSTSLSSGATAATVTANELWIGVGGIRNVSGATFSSAQINSVNADNTYQTATTIGGTADRAACFFYRIVSAAGNTPSATATSSGTGIHVTFCVTFKEAPATGAGFFVQ